MEYIYYEDNPQLAKSRFAACLAGGGTAVIPAGTVYGLVAHSESAEAYRQIFRIKRREASKPIALLVSDTSPAFQSLLTVLNGQAGLLAEFLAGQLTVVLDAERLEGLPAPLQQIQPGKVGLRHPANSPAAALLQAAGGLAWATSANFSESPPCSTEGEVKSWLQEAQPAPGLTVLSHHPQQGQPSRVEIIHA